MPDVAGNAGGGYVIYYAGAKIAPLVGTSCVAPLYAGLLAQIVSGMGKRVGWLNPVLYAPPYRVVCRDLYDGVNNADLDSPGYIAGSGWDACTGFGVLDGTALYDVLIALIKLQGEFVSQPGLPEVYRMAGGAPIYVSSWEDVGGPQPVNSLEGEWTDTPLDGTYLQGYTTNFVYRVAGGAPIYVTNWDHIGARRPLPLSIRSRWIVQVRRLPSTI